MTEPLQVRQPELTAHARTVEAVAGQVAVAGAAGRAVRAGPGAYGRLCTLVPTALGALQDVLTAAIDATAAALRDGGAGLRANADGYTAADQRRADAFRAVPGRR
ncbi:type VII secretion target [Actinoplanes sp. G11-F43]|uniref:type VII secretion target n=1 Tax=Actinoplanes sp. G11-F43 TaxID=3424130 RepID=UPI003D354306